MAHEIAHVAARHSTEQVSKGQLFNFASLPLIFLGGPAGYTIRQAASLMLPMEMLAVQPKGGTGSRLSRATVPIQGRLRSNILCLIFRESEVTGKTKSGFLAKAFSTHPVTEDRIRKAQQQIEQKLPAREEYALSSSQFERIKARLEILEISRKLEEEKEEDPNRPRLQRRTSNTIEDEEESATETDEDTDLQLTEK